MKKTPANRPDPAAIQRMGPDSLPQEQSPVRVPSPERVGGNPVVQPSQPPRIPEANIPKAALQMKRKRRKSKGNAWIALGLVLILLLSTLVFLWVWMFSGVRQVEDHSLAPRSSNQQSAQGDQLPVVPYDQELTNILLIGVDSREEDELNTNSDTMMILTLDQKAGKIKLTSFQRDMLLKMPGQDGFFKLNSAMFSGPQHLLDTLNYNFKLDLKDFIVINMRGAEDVVDAIGGLTLSLPNDQDQIDYLNEIIWDTNREMNGAKYWAQPIEHGGQQHLNGRQSISFARMRKLDSDFVRMERQQLLLKTLFNAFKECGPLEKLQVIREGLNLISTNVSNRTLLGLALACLQKADHPIETLSVPMEGYFEDQIVNGTAAIIPHVRDLTPKLHHFLYGAFHDNGVQVEEFDFGSPPAYIPAPDETRSENPWSQIQQPRPVETTKPQWDYTQPNRDSHEKEDRRDTGENWLPGFRNDQITLPTVTEKREER